MAKSCGHFDLIKVNFHTRGLKFDLHQDNFEFLFCVSVCVSAGVVSVDGDFAVNKDRYSNHIVSKKIRLQAKISCLSISRVRNFSVGKY